MKKGFNCPKCGNLDTIKLLITTIKGTTLSILLASQTVINRLGTKICCLECSHCGTPEEFRKSRQ